MKMDAMQPEQGAFNFVKVDEMVQMAKEHDIKLRGHVLVWGEALPAWVTQQIADRRFSRTSAQNSYPGDCHPLSGQHRHI